MEAGGEREKNIKNRGKKASENWTKNDSDTDVKEEQSSYLRKKNTKKQVAKFCKFWVIGTTVTFPCFYNSHFKKKDG
jgi:hypothetical protein